MHYQDTLRLDIVWPKTLEHFRYLGNDVFFRKATLRHLAEQGVDLSRARFFDSGRSPLNRALVNHNRWFNRKEVQGQNKIIMPWAFHEDFPQKDKVRQIVARMNQDLGCVANWEETNLQVWLKTFFTAAKKNKLLIL